MRILIHAALAGAIVVAGASPVLSRGMAGGFARSAGAHAFGNISAQPLHFAFAPLVFRVGFPQARFGQARFEGWSGGAYSADVAASEDVGIDPDNIYFRVQEPFGPGDLGRPQAPQPPSEMGGWEGPPPAYANGPPGMEDR